MPEISVEAFATLFRRAGLDIAPDTMAELHATYGAVEAMIDRVRAHDSGEPSEIFAPIESP